MAEEQTVQTPETPPAAPVTDPPAEPAQQAAPETPPSETPPTDGQSPTPPETPPEPESDAGVVPAPEAYVLPEGMPEELRQFAHTNQFTQAQLDASLTQFTNYANGMRQAELQAMYDMGQAHIKNWGDAAETNLTLARQALRQNDPDGKLSEALKNSGWANHPAVLDFLTSLGRSMQEGGFLKTTVRRPPGEKTLAQSLFPNHPSQEG